MTQIARVLALNAFSVICLMSLEAAPALAAKLTPVVGIPGGQCSAMWGCAARAWRVEGAPDLYFVTTAHPDDNYAAFFRLDDKGEAVWLMDVVPVVRNPDGTTAYGNMHDLKALPATQGPAGLEVMASVLDDYADGHDACRPAWQKRMALVMFSTAGRGEGTAPDAKNFKPVALADLAGQTRTASPKTKTHPVCKNDCCSFQAVAK
jgi:hypothetical protein